MLVTTEKMLQDAQQNHYAIGAFNVENMEMVQAVVEAAEEMRSAVILQTTPSTLKYAAPELYFANVQAAASKASVPIAIHLDHGNSFELAMRAFRCGYTSIMIDGSRETFEENIALTQAVVKAAHAANICVEAELGTVGGKEDSLDNGTGGYTDPMKANEFTQRSGCDSLAVAIGTAHGIYKHAVKLDLDRLSEIRKAVNVPLVLHGTSGVEDDLVRECVKRGICKVNYATDLRIAYTKGVKEVLDENPDTIDPKKYGARGREYVKEYVKKKIVVVGSANRF